MSLAVPTECSAAGCPICGSTDTFSWRKGGLEGSVSPEDLRITDARYGLTLDLARCRHCGFRFADSEDVARLDHLYADLDDPGYEQSQTPRRLQMEWLVRTVRERHPAAKTAVDVGAATGLLVAEARRAGLDADGVEPSRTLSELARRHNGVPVLTGVLPHPDLLGRSFDVVFLVDVIEHVAEPLQLLERCAELLAPDGLLLVVTPDVASLAARALGRRWWHFRIAHVGYFDRRSLALALERAGLRAEGWLRARWFFDVAYLASRLESYLPVGPLNRLAQRTPGLRRLYRSVIPVNLFDSYAVLARPVAGRG
jgi:SAM-dependent methyltransferase